MIESNLVKIMEKKKISCRKLANLSGVAGQTITRARGKLIYECKLSTLDALATALEVELKALFDEVRSEPAETGGDSRSGREAYKPIG